MSYTLGGATTDDIIINYAALGFSNMFVDNSSTLILGWWYPTTLTATRGYWSILNTIGAEVDGTTSEIRMRTDNTTDGQWLTSGAGIVVNKWHFLAFLNAAENTTVAGAWRVWVGDAFTSPVEVTVTNPVVRSGNYVGGATFYLGNKGTGSLAFQGDIGWAACISQLTNVGINGALGIATSGVIDNAEADLVLNRWVRPFWLGRPPNLDFWKLATTQYFLESLENELAFCEMAVAPNAPNTYKDTFGTTAVFTQHQPPIRCPHPWPHQRLYPFAHRR